VCVRYCFHSIGVNTEKTGRLVRRSDYNIPVVPCSPLLLSKSTICLAMQETAPPSSFSGSRLVLPYGGLSLREVSGDQPVNCNHTTACAALIWTCHAGATNSGRLSARVTCREKTSHRCHGSILSRVACEVSQVGGSLSRLEIPRPPQLVQPPGQIGKLHHLAELYCLRHGGKTRVDVTNRVSRFKNNRRPLLTSVIP